MTPQAQSILNELTERSTRPERNFLWGPASDTVSIGYAMSEADRSLLRGYQELIAAGLITETKTHFRSNGYYRSAYRIVGSE